MDELEIQTEANSVEARLADFQEKYGARFKKIAGILDKVGVCEERTQSFPFIEGEMFDQHCVDRPHNYAAQASILINNFMSSMTLEHIKAARTTFGEKKVGSMQPLHVDPNFPQNGRPYYKDPETFMTLMEGWLKDLEEAGTNAVQRKDDRAAKQIVEAYDTIADTLKEWRDSNYIGSLYADACDRAQSLHAEEQNKWAQERNDARTVAKKTFLEMTKNNQNQTGRS